MSAARRFRPLALAALVACAGCASISAGADFDPATRLDAYHSFDWGAGDTLPAGDPRLDHNPFFDSRVRAAVELELAAKGIRRSSASPDLLIHYHASVRQRVDVVHTDEARGYTDPMAQRPDGGTVVQFDEGTLLLDFADARTRAIVWRGWAQTDVSGLVEDPRQMEQRITQSLREMLKRFPQVGTPVATAGSR